MDNGVKIYQELVDSLVDISKNCVDAKWAIDGKAKGDDEHIAKLNKLFAKLSAEDREVLAEYASNAYMSGIYDALCEIEWYIDCRDMKITVEGEELPATKFEGLGNDFIGRRDAWEWPE